ncbi:hypothetical protein PRIPAC_94110 [Pristionchus pacificus]|uniref:F-box domain-containing protein n=1 Tax=Pristionchus pacificus TaxID=54126 RepID=A0A2A6BPC2_PRIPA|nr:hypothetical protein PRIPAC_94110 [Pristionchus pacificus]|eukprot:PDM67760.1 hypothetical protein PRIPAC_45804 [Pristionchus pacificus]
MVQPRKSARKRQVAATEEQSMRLSKRARFNEKYHKSSLPVPEFPDDILRIIFKKLSTDERKPLGLVSKRFRSIDHDIGQRVFDEIRVFHENENCVHIAANLSRCRYEFHSIEIEPTNEIVPLNFFKNSSSQSLSIFVDRNVKVDKLLTLHCALFMTLHFKELYIHFDSSRNILDVLYRFCSTILSTGGELKDVTLDLRIALQSFPQLENNSLEIPVAIGRSGNKIASFPTFVCDGKTMMHLITNSNNAYLGSVECTAQELFEAFEILCDSKIITKRATLLVLQSTVDELFLIAEQRPYLMVILFFRVVDLPGSKDREFFDPIRGGILYMESASCGSDPPLMRWSSVYGEAPDRRSEQERESDHLAVAEKFVAQRIRLKQHYGWPERDVIPMKSLSGWSALVRFQARAAMKPVVRLQDYESKVTTAAAHGYGSPVSRKPDPMEASDESCSAKSRTTRRRVRPPELTTP